MKRTDIEVLQRTLNTNGGGYCPGYGKESAIKRLLKAGLIQRKPNQYRNRFGDHDIQYTLTSAGKAKCKELSLVMVTRNQRALDKWADREMFGADVERFGLENVGNK